MQNQVGLMSAAKAAPPAPVADPAMAQEAAPAQGSPLTEIQQASPEEQKLYDKFVAKAFDAIYDKASLPGILTMLEGDGDPIEGLAKATVGVVSRVQAAAVAAGQKLPGDVVFHAGKEVFEDLAELSREAKIKDFSQDEDALEAAFFRALDEYRLMMQSSPDFDQAAFQRDFDQLKAMDEAGQLESLFIGLAESDAKNKMPPEEAMPAKKQGGLMRAEAV